MLIWQKKDKFEENKKQNFSKLILGFNSKKIFIAKFIALISIVGIFFVPLDLGINKSTKLSRFSSTISNSLYLALGGFNKSFGHLAKETFQYGDSLFFITYRYFRSAFFSSDELRLNLNIKNYNNLKAKRNKAMKDGILIRSENDEVEGSITYKDKNYPIRIRLKGDWTDHLIGDKWSFRIKTRKGKAFLGMKEFSLQHPRTRNYINEFLFHELLKYEKLPYLRYKFMPLFINGKNLGIYALEEHFAKQLIENSGFREGPILKISDYFRNETQRMIKIDGSKNFHLRSKNNANIETFNIKRIQENKPKLSQFLLASNLLEQFLQKKINTSDVFDIKMTAKYFALNDLLQSGSSNTWYDMRYYFDPITARLIPIGYDASPPIRSFRRYLSSDINALDLFADSNFFREYVRNLERISSDNYLDKLLSNISKDLEISLASINKTFPHVNFLRGELEKNQQYIKNRLTPLRAIAISPNDLIKKDKEIILKLANKTSFPIEVISIQSDKGLYLMSEKKSINNYLSSWDGLNRLNFTEYKFVKSNLKNNLKISPNKLVINYKILGSSKVVSMQENIFPNLISTSTNNDFVKRVPNYSSNSSLLFDNDNKKIFLKNNLVIKSPIILPSEYEFHIKEGVNIDLQKEGYILVQGPLKIFGTAENNVTIKGNNMGNGIVVINSSEKSYISHAIFEGLRAPTEISTSIMGGLNFYNSPVEIYNSKFTNSKSEDALNVFRSPFKISNTLFKKTFSDAFDADFSDGTIENSSFLDIGNDGIDVSGSSVTINKIEINSAGDKSISVGEKSKLIGNDIILKNSFIGIASKDLSNAKVKNLFTDNLSICLAAYQKKPEYGPGFISVNKIDNNCMKNFLLEPGSSISSSTALFIPNTKNVYKKLYIKDNEQ